MKEELLKLHKNAIALQEVMKFTYLSDDNKISQYGGFGNFARKYHELFVRVPASIDRSLLDRYDIDKMPNPNSLTWPQQKNIFDGILLNVGLLISILENNLDLKTSKIEELKNFLSSHLQ